jgi:Uma2 family endonuclease
MSTASSIQPQFPRKQAVPPLQNGDRLTREEFERRYKATPEKFKAELIEGVVYVASPVSSHHCDPHFDLIGALSAYRFATPGVAGGDNGTIRLDMDNEPQPDIHLRLRPEFGGRARIEEDGYITGSPELVAEIAASSASYDLNVKLNAYRRNGIQEYLVWRTFDDAIDWFALHGGNYERLSTGGDGIVRSEVFPGLWLHPVALMSGDSQALISAVQQGLASPEHAAFVARLRSAASASK